MLKVFLYVHIANKASETFFFEPSDSEIFEAESSSRLLSFDLSFAYLPHSAFEAPPLLSLERLLSDAILHPGTRT